MADETQTPTTDTSDVTVGETTSTTPEEGAGEKRTPDSYQAEIAKLRKENAKYRTERNKFKADAEAFREIKESEKTELERAQDELAKARERVAALDAQLQRSRVLTKFGIAEENADLLGNDPERFEENAQRLADLQTEAARKAAPPSEVPISDLSKTNAPTQQVKSDYAFPDTWPVTGPFAHSK